MKNFFKLIVVLLLLTSAANATALNGSETVQVTGSTNSPSGIASGYPASVKISDIIAWINSTYSTFVLGVANGGDQQNGGYINVKDAPYSASGNWTQLIDAVMTSGSAALNSSSANFTSADVGKIIIVYGAGTNGAALSSTIASYVDARDITLAANAATSVSSSANYAYVAGTNTSQSGSGSYAPGDTITLTATNATYQTTLNVLTTQVASATVNATGSGGTNGSCVLSGTTGSGALKFQINATISGNAISALGGFVTSGSYTTNPTSLTAEPVTGCNLSGATLTLKMGTQNVSVANGGSYSTYPTSPVAQTSTSGSGTGATFNVESRQKGTFEYGYDDTTAIQAAITAAPAYGTVYLPCGTYRITGTPAINKALTLKGCASYSVHTPYSVATPGFDSANIPPYVAGSVLLEETAATNALNITSSAVPVNLFDFAIRFGDQIRNINTGHGIYAVSSTLYSGLPDHGVFDADWARIRVFGTDGNHYSYFVTNTAYSTFTSLKSFGGGGFDINTNSNAGNYGNSVFIEPYVELFENGSSYAYNIVAVGGTGQSNLFSFIRPQGIVESYTGTFSETISPTIAYQYDWNSSTTSRMSVISPDFEPSGTGSPPMVAFNPVSFITTEGLFGSNPMKNTWYGNEALNSLTTGVGDSAYGYYSSASLTTGSYNTNLGYQTGESMTTAQYNTCVGDSPCSTLNSNNNVAVGAFSVGGTASGGANTAVGYLSLNGTTSYQNSAFGYSAGSKITSGNNNVTIGASVGSTTLTTGSNNILIGTSSAVDVTTNSDSNKINIGALWFGNTLTNGVPVVTSCGTNTVESHSNNAHGQINITAGTPAACTITFAGAYSTWVHCIVTAESTTAVFQYTASTTAIALTATALAGKYDYMCQGY